jgi:hypothetical protein
MSFNRIAAIGGVVGVLLVLPNLILLGDQPTLDDPTADVIDYLADDVDLHRTASILGVLTMPFFVVFFAAVVSKMRANDREHGEGWAIAALAAAILFGATSMTGDALTGVLFLRAGEGLDAAAVRAIYDASWLSYASGGIALGALAASVAIPTIQHRFWPVWYGWLSGVVAVLGVISVAGVQWTSDTALVLSFAMFLGFLVWTVVTSVLLYREG